MVHLAQGLGVRATLVQRNDGLVCAQWVYFFWALRESGFSTFTWGFLSVSQLVQGLQLGHVVSSGSGFRVV